VTCNRYEEENCSDLLKLFFHAHDLPLREIFSTTLSREACCRSSIFCFFLIRHFAAASLFFSSDCLRLMHSGESAWSELGEALRVDFRFRLDNDLE
jgi:hypothetical protein